MKIKNKKLIYSVLILLALTLGFSIGFFSPTIDNDSESNTRPNASAGEITIVTPENKTYTEPNSGYFPATYGFENDLDGTIPDKHDQ